MKIKQIIPLCFLGGVFTLFGLYTTRIPFKPELIQESSIRIDSSRTVSTPLSKLLENQTSTLVNATSQFQLLNEQREDLEIEIQALQQQVDELMIQRNILVEEISPYIESISIQILNPLTKIQQQLEKQLQKKSQDSVIEDVLYVISHATNAVEQYMTNPNEPTYETSLQTAFRLMDDELAQHDVNSVMSVASEMIQSGYTNTMIRMKLQQSKELLQAFEANYIAVENDETAQFKRSKQQQLATEDAFNLKALQLDELALRLSGILDEIEQVTQ